MYTNYNSYLYLMKVSGTNNFKIGISKEPLRREKNIQTKLGKEVELLCYRRVMYTKFFEGLLHRLLKSKNIRFSKSGREWFYFRISFTPRMLIWVVGWVSYLVVLLQLLIVVGFIWMVGFMVMA